MKKYNMKPIVKLMDESINKLNELNEHGMKCSDCWGSGWETQFIKACKKCNGTGNYKIL